MKRVSETEHNLVIEIPPIVGIGIVRIEPWLTVIIPFDIEHARVANRVRIVHAPIRATTP